MAEHTVVYEHYNFTLEEQVAILRSFTPDQVALLKSYLCECVEYRASLEYDPGSPMAQVKAGGYYSGKIELLRLFLNPELTLVGDTQNGGI